jgi:hypothetical protein
MALCASLAFKPLFTAPLKVAARFFTSLEKIKK